ncbi:hypothetical protein B9Z55_018091 [Caenorhabditis nigoni]|uniref:Uncharacterized protein n=1 Tax=Caenorhabditis nigoni TaxID=1611254 RepID=A0A2G5TD40_9PELO|nr:hypothetical protein B9Z55_018091 [Caenorhabditis nigoni]
MTAVRQQRLGLLDSFPKSGIPITVTTPAVIEAVQEKTRRNPEKSTRKMANDFNTYHRLMKTIANQTIYLYSYLIQMATFLTKKNQLLRKKKAQHLLGGTPSHFFLF